MPVAHLVVRGTLCSAAVSSPASHFEISSIFAFPPCPSKAYSIANFRVRHIDRFVGFVGEFQQA